MTINEIAKLAGVSASTVSKIMNNKDSSTSPMLLSIPPEPSRLYVSAL